MKDMKDYLFVQDTLNPQVKKLRSFWMVAWLKENLYTKQLLNPIKLY